MKNNFNLTQWQKRQAALLYHFSSTDYLIGLRDRVNGLFRFTEVLLQTSRAQGRDRLMRSKQWGDRDTTENWADSAWPFLADFQVSIARDIADRASDTYHVTGRYSCGRGLSEYSMQWTTQDEEKQFETMYEEISNYASYIDRTMDKSARTSRWNDFSFALAWRDHASAFPNLPKFRVREDITTDSGQCPTKAGVYISLDDPYASLQFAWPGTPLGRLLEGSTFNELGKNALAAVGRTRLWIDDSAMHGFVCANLSNPAFTADSFFDGAPTPELAPSLVARNAFTSHPSKWCFLELVDGEFEPLEELADPRSQPIENRRFPAGDNCDVSGYYFTPARLDSRRWFNANEVFPHLDSTYGKTIWQWDIQQN